MDEPQLRRLRCLWMDLKVSVAIVETPRWFAVQCNVRRVTGFDEAAATAADFVVFEFDYPGRKDLDRAAALKKDRQHIPMVAITVQHSEALTSWFFRQHFFDCLVQPLSHEEVSGCLERLRSVIALTPRQPRRAFAKVSLPPPPEAVSHGSARARLQPAVSLVERCYHKRLPVSEAANACGMPPLRFGREFKDYFGLEFREFVLRYRIREACRLLRNPDASVTEVGYSVGFSEPSYFAKMFKRFVGRPPSATVGDPTLDFALELPAAQNYQHSFQNS